MGVSWVWMRAAETGRCPAGGGDDLWSCGGKPCDAERAEGHGSGRDDETMEFAARAARITACYTADDDARVPVIVLISR